MHSRARNALNFNSNLFNLRDKLVRDLSLQKHIYDIQHRSINFQRQPIKHTSSYALSLQTTISSIPKSKKTISSNSLYKTSSKKPISLRDNLISSRINFYKHKSKEIERNNTYFNNRLTRVSSPLSRKRLEDSYFKLQKYEQISKKVKLSKDNKKRETNLLRKLPMLYIKGNKFVAY